MIEEVHNTALSQLRATIDFQIFELDLPLFQASLDIFRAASTETKESSHLITADSELLTSEGAVFITTSQPKQLAIVPKQCVHQSPATSKTEHTLLPQLVLLFQRTVVRLASWWFRFPVA